MSGDHGLSDLRFEGYSNHELASQIDGLRTGSGASGLHQAAEALIDIAKALAATDAVLRVELAKIGVEWQGQAAEGGTEATQNASIYAEDAVRPTTESSGGVQVQGETYAHITNNAPESGTLRGPTELNGVDRFAGVFGFTTDHARDVEATSAARDQAVAGMTSYQAGSQQALDHYRPLPVPPGMSLVAQPVEGSTQTNSVGSLGGSGGPGPGGGTGGPGSLSGGGAGGSFGGPAPFGGSGPDAPPGGRGNFSGVGPFVPPGTGPPGSPVGPQGGLPRVPPMFVGDAALLAGAGAAGAAAGAGSEKDRLVRGRPGQGGVGGGPDRAGGRGGVPVASVPDDEAKAARNAEKFGARSGRPGAGSIMQPAATAGGGRKEEDAEHVRKYGIDSGDVFDDDRLTAPASIGDDQDDRRAT